MTKTAASRHYQHELILLITSHNHNADKSISEPTKTNVQSVALAVRASCNNNENLKVNTISENKILSS